MTAAATPRTVGHVKGEAKTGEYVSYSDMANQPKTVLVAGTHTSQWGTEYLLANEHGSIASTSDLRQHGWVFVEAPGWNLDMASVPMADGNSYPVPAGIAEKFRGLDDQRNVVIKGWDNSDGTEYLIPLTPCCLATGKGMEGGVGCRNCYEYVDDYFGGPAEVIATRA
jgi:hypothetical protein